MAKWGSDTSPFDTIIQGNRRLTAHTQARRKHGAVLATIKTKPLRGAFGPS